jgi:uncharacterized protein YjgD (DUF1641 family)
MEFKIKSEELLLEAKSKELFLEAFQAQHEATIEIVNTMLNYLLSTIYLDKLDKDNGEHPQNMLEILKQMWITDFNNLINHFYEVYSIIKDCRSDND